MRANYLTRQVPVLVLSGHSLTEEDVRRLDYANVTFHSKGLLSPEEAIEGFQKALSGQMTLPQSTSTLVKHVLAYFHQNYQNPLSRQQVASAVGVSEDYLSRIFHKEMGLSPWECLNRHRIQKARELLAQTSKSITEIAAEVGFEDSAYFSRVFRQYSGQSPKNYRLH
jgi:transcriptional regulator GlxA family with amidase domain